MNRFSQYLTLIVVFHFIVVVFHGSAHHMIPIPTSLLQSLFIISIITLAPLVGTIILWRKSFNIRGLICLRSCLNSARVVTMLSCEYLPIASLKRT